MANRRRRRRYRIDWRRLLPVVGVLVVAIVLVCVFARPPVQDQAASANVAQTAQPESTPVADVTDVAEPPETDETEPPASDTGEDADPYAGVEMLPILSKAKKAPGKLAFTIDDCFQTDNLRKILDLADQYGAKLTFFPIGKVAKKSPELWRDIYARGHEIENHTYNHASLTGQTDEELREEIVKQNAVICDILGVNYHMRYFRPMGGTGRKEPRLHKILGELGYEAVASWGLSGTRKSSETISMLSDGQIILFHTTDKDLKRLKSVIPAAVKAGYQLVTINELYGREPNLTTPLEADTQT